MNLAQYALTLALRVYRGLISPVLTAVFAPMGFGCRYTPTCSRYALEAVRVHGAGRGTWLAAQRVCRCHPWGGCGHDPVPPASMGQKSVFGRVGCADGSFPLTPALSLGEREFTETAAEADEAVEPSNAQGLFPDWPSNLPLPKGEGRREGEGHAPLRPAFRTAFASTPRRPDISQQTTCRHGS